MSIKSEPMDFELEALEHSVVIPLHVVANSTVADDRAAMQTTHDSSFPQPLFNSVNQTLSSTDKYVRTDRPVPERVSSVSKRNYFGNSSGTRFYSSVKTSHPNFTISRGEIELNSKFLPKKYRCGFCVYKTSYKSDLNRHLRRHSSHDNFHCEDCNMPFKTVGLVFHHKRTVHGAGPVPAQAIYQCHVCPYGTSFEARYNRHLQLHSTCKYTCDVCNKPFVVDTLLRHHKLSVHGIVHSFTGSSGDIRPRDTLKNTENSSCRFQTPPVSKQVSFQSSTSFETIVVNDDPVDVGSLNYCSARGLNNAADSIGNEVITESPRPSLTQELTNEVDSTCNGNSIEDKPQPSEVSFVSKSFDSNCMDPYLRQDDTRNQMARSELIVEESNKVCNENRSDPLNELIMVSATVDASVKPVFNEQDELLIQATSVPNTKQYFCERCGGSFKSLDGILNHKPTCGAEDVSPVQKCPLCPFQTTNHHAHLRHCQKHSMAPHCCELCNRPFVAVANLIKHKTEVHGNMSVRNARFKSLPKTIGRLNHQRREISSDVDTCYPSRRPKRQLHVGSEEMHLPNRPDDLDNFLETTDIIDKTSDDLFNVTFNSVKKDKKESEKLVFSQPPEYGRYAKLVSDFDEFARRPYACALCFFRTNNVTELSRHAENHLTGCNITPIPETARFTSSYKSTEPNQSRESKQTSEPEVTEIQIQNGEINEFPTSFQGEPSNVIAESKTPVVMEANNLKSHDKETDDGNKLLISDSVNNCSLKSSDGFIKRLRNPNAFLYKSSRPCRTKFSCNACEKSFSLRLLLARHLRKIHRSVTISDSN